MQLRQVKPQSKGTGFVKRTVWLKHMLYCIGSGGRGETLNGLKGVEAGGTAGRIETKKWTPSGHG